METKKANHANLEKRRPFFIQMGFIISLTLVLMAFEWSVERSAAREFGTLADVALEEDMVITRQKEPEKEIEPPKPKVTELLTIVENTDEPDDDLDFTTETDENEWSNTDFKLDDEVGDDDIPFEFVQNMPIFRPSINSTKEQGDLDMHRYVLKKARYPEMARETGIQGRVWVKFIVNKKGKVSNVEVERGIDALLNNEALRVVRDLPDFSPGKQRGKAVRVLYRVPINFKLG